MGGPYLKKPKGIAGVKLAPEIGAECDVSLDIPDFGVPALEDVNRAVQEAMTILEKDGCIYVGCMGGIGRTGMIIACLMKEIARQNIIHNDTKLLTRVKSWIIKHLFDDTYDENLIWRYIEMYALEFTREHYLSYAVETSAQEDLIADY